MIPTPFLIFWAQSEIERLLYSRRIFKKDKIVLLLDDNIGTGTTIKEIKRLLSQNGITRVISVEAIMT